MIRATILLVSSALALGLTACSDDDPVTPDDSFAIEITVLDVDGQPLANQPVLVLPQLPRGVLQDDWKTAMPAAVRLPFVVPVACIVDLEIRDVAGAVMRHLLEDYEAAAGSHTVMWNGLNDDGYEWYTGWFAAVLTCRDAEADTLMFTDERDMLMVSIDYDRTAYHTDADGKLTITDRRVVPGFWDVPEMRFNNEDGDPTGYHTFTDSTQIRAAGDRVVFAAVDGYQSFTLQRPAPLAGEPAAATAELVTRPSTSVPPHDVGFEFGYPMPNPFN